MSPFFDGLGSGKKKLFQVLFIRVILQNLVFHGNKQGNLLNRRENN
jgi:hypothetical protein